MTEYTSKELLNTCSPEVQNGYEYLMKNAEKLKDISDKYQPESSIIFYVLDDINSPLSEEYLGNMYGKTRPSPSQELVTYPYKLWFLAKLFKKYDMSYKQNATISSVIDDIKNWQNRDGSLPGEINTAGRLRLLNLVEPESTVTKQAESYFKQNWKKHQSEIELSLGILSLSEINYDQYRSLIGTMAEKLVDSQSREGYFGQLIFDPSEPDAPKFYPIEETGLAMRALSRVGGYKDELEEAAEWLRKEQMVHGQWVQNESIHHRNLSHRLISTSYALLGLNTTLDGPQISQSMAEWETELEKQRKNKIRPDFLQTYPSSSLENRRIEIREQAESMIVSADDEIRICSLMIDMLHDELIDKVEKGVDLRVLTRGGHERGERKKLKSAVIKELVKKTEGNVKSDHLVHSRLLIVDKSGLLVSTADLTRDQLYDEFNSGIYTKDTETIKTAIEYFDSIWEDADPMNPN